MCAICFIAIAMAVVALKSPTRKFRNTHKHTQVAKAESVLTVEAESSRALRLINVLNLYIVNDRGQVRQVGGASMWGAGEEVREQKYKYVKLVCASSLLLYLAEGLRVKCYTHMCALLINSNY